MIFLNYFPTDKNWLMLFLSLGKKRKGFGKANVTPYMHATVYHVWDVIQKYGNIKQFSGQGKLI